MSIPLSPQNVAFWHDRTPAQHSEHMNTLRAQGYQPMSLSIYGDPPNPLYAAVVVKGYLWSFLKEVGPVDRDHMQQEIDDSAQQGFGPYLLTATGPKESTLYAAVFRLMTPLPHTNINLSHMTMTSENAAQHSLGRVLWCLNAFGTAARPRYAAIWGPNPGPQSWSTDFLDVASNTQEFLMDWEMLLSRYNALAGAGCCPDQITMSPAGRCIVSFVDSKLTHREIRAHLTADRFKLELQTQVAASRMPIQMR